MNHISKMIFILCAGVIFSACTPIIYSGNISLSPEIAQRFERFIENDEAEDFFVAVDGRAHSYMIYCPYRSCAPGNRQVRAKECESYAGMPCGLFASSRNILWENAGNFMPYRSEIVKRRYGSYYYDGNGSVDNSSPTVKTTPQTAPNNDISKYAGSGDIVLSDQVAKKFTEFANASSMTHFYISTDGQTAHSASCPNGTCKNKTHTDHISRCASEAGTFCRLFATKDKIIWASPGNFMPFKSEIIHEKYGVYFH